MLTHILKSLILFSLAFTQYSYASPTQYVAVQPIENRVISDSTTVIAAIRHLPSVDFYANSSGMVDFVIPPTQSIIKKGNPVITINSYTSTTAIDEAEIAVQHAQENYNRDKALFDKKFIAAAKLESSTRLLKQAKTKLANAQKAIEDTKFIAPFEGRVGGVHYKQGDRVKPGQFLASIVGSNATELTAFLPQQLFAFNKLEAELTLGSGLQIKPQLISRSPYIDNDSGNFTAIFKAEYLPELMHKSYVELTVTSNSHTALTIPEKAVMVDRDGAYIFVAQDNQAQRINISRGTRTPPLVEIISEELNEGDQVIVEGMHKVSDQSPIEIVER